MPLLVISATLDTGAAVEVMEAAAVVAATSAEVTAAEVGVAEVDMMTEGKIIPMILFIWILSSTLIADKYDCLIL